MNERARELIELLQLEPLPEEGGFFRQTWRSEHGSAIYYLMTPEGFSALHRLAQEETWHFYGGDRVEHVQFDPRGGGIEVSRMGMAIFAGEVPQAHVPAGWWQGARIAPEGATQGWTLLGCTLCPPWDERGFELGGREGLLRDFPQHAAWVRALTR
jgi:hypothetical protein